MALKIQRQPEFWTDVTFLAPGGEPAGTARMKWRATTRTEYYELLKLPADEIISKVLLGWDGIEDEFNPVNVARLIDELPSSARDMLDSFTRGLFAAERKN